MTKSIRTRGKMRDVNRSLGRRVREFYRRHLPIGDRIGEIFYATWMVVVSLGIINSAADQAELVPLAIAVAFGVNITWGLIDGISVMLSNVIDRARMEGILFNLRTRNDTMARQDARDVLGETVLFALDDAEKERTIDRLAEGEPGGDPSKKSYYPAREDWHYAIGILAIDILFVIPIVVPLLVIHNVPDAILASRVVATLIFAALGAAYARRLNRNRLLAALFLGALGFSVFSLAYLLGW